MSLILDDPTLLQTRSYINGEWIDGESTFPVYNPATSEVIAEVASLGKSGAEESVRAAKSAMKAWQAKTAKERANILRTWFNLIMENQEDLGRIMTAEQGKPLAEAKGEIAYGASYIEWFAEEAKRIYGVTIPGPSNDRRIVVIKQPIGVVAAITPWNFPSSMITRKVAPALAAGCTITVKPARETPLSALALCVLAERAGIPAGVLNMLTSASSSAIGEVFTRDPRVAKFSFTGSTPIGKMLAEQCQSTIKKIAMELGGNAPFIVFDDADLDAAVVGAMASKYRNAGQTCVCANRLFVQEGVYAAFVEKLTAAVQALKLGNGMDKGVTTGPLVNAGAANDVNELVQDALVNGATAVVGGDRGELGDCYFQPTILTDVNDRMRVFREEIFGPVAPVFKFKTEEEVIAAANDTEFGLASYFYSRDVGRIWRVGEGLEYGMVGINDGIISNEAAPFGGIKESGIGREGSKYGIEEYVEIKYLLMGGLDS